MVARVDGAMSFAVHRTFLADQGNGKTHLHPAKAMLGSCKGGAVHLSSMDIHSEGGPLVVTEGIENGLALLSGLLDAPATVWAALSTSGIVSLKLQRCGLRLPRSKNMAGLCHCHPVKSSEGLHAAKRGGSCENSGLCRRCRRCRKGVEGGEPPFAAGP
jgi:hypothetical protein